MYLKLSMYDSRYCTEVRGISRAEAHKLITALGEQDRDGQVRVQLEPETVEERLEQSRGVYSEGYEVER